MSRILHRTSFEALCEFNSVHKRLEIKEKRQTTLANNRLLRKAMQGLKDLRGDIQRLKQLSNVFVKNNALFFCSKLFTRWRRFTFSSEMSLFNKEVEAKDYFKQRSKKLMFASWKRDSVFKKRQESAVDELERRVRNRLLGKAFTGLLIARAKCNEREAIKQTNMYFNAWKK